MPIIQVEMLEGRTTEQKEEFIEQVTDLAVETLDARRQGVRVILREMEPENFGLAGESIRQKRESGADPT